MGRRGWNGAPPSDDDDARRRIVEAAMRSVNRRGAPSTTLSSVADELGVTRRTVYRYFGSREDLFSAVAEFAVTAWGSNLAAKVANIDDVTEMIVAAMAEIISTMPDDFTLLVAIDRHDLFSRRMLQAGPFDLARRFLLNTKFDWDTLGFDDQRINELIELMLRLIQSMLIAPVDPPRSDEELRSYLRRWLGPALRSR
jgi:AcrR family transcriptional regulator